MNFKRILSINKIQIDWQDALLFTLISQKGTLIYNEENILLDIPLKLSPGLYHLEITGKERVIQTKILI